MSRATSAVDMWAVSGRPVVEHASPNPRAEVTKARSWAEPHGNATDIPASAADCAPRSAKHRTSAEKFVPRGSIPTMSNRASTSDERKVDAWAAMETLDPPGPPGLTKSVPILCLWSGAGSRSTATSVVAPLGAS